MKKFNEINIGETIYSINEDCKIKSHLVCGIEDINLRHYKICIKLIDNKQLTTYFDADKVKTEDGELYFSCLEEAQIERTKLKNRFINQQFNIALSALRNIKKFDHNSEINKERILKLFQMVDK